jgi:hypothetical protein
MGDLPLPQPSPSNKRDRDQIDSSTEESETIKSRPEAFEEPRRIAGSRRVASKYGLQSNQNVRISQIPKQNTSTSSTLATRSKEFGNLPYSQSDSTMMPPLNPDLFPATGVVDHLTFGAIATDGGWPTEMNMEPSTNPLFYDQMGSIFSTPFGEMTEEELAMVIINASATQTVPNDETNVLYQASVDPK